MPLANPRQGNITESVISEQAVYHLIHVQCLELTSISSNQEAPVIIVQRLQDLVGSLTLAHKSPVEGPEGTDVLIVLVLDKLEDYLIVRLNLQHF